MNKKKGFVLIFVMLIISALTLLVIGVSSLTVQSKNKSSIFSQKQEEDIILNNSIECILSLINTSSKEKEEKEDSKKKDTEKKEEKEEDPFEKYKNRAMQFLNIFYKKQTLNFNFQEHHATGVVNFYIACEDSKIPLKNSIHILREEAAKEEEKEAAGKVLGGAAQEKPEEKPEENAPDKAKEEKKKKNITKIEKALEFLEKKSKVFKNNNLTKDLVKTGIEEYSKKKDVLITDALSDILKKKNQEIYGILNDNWNIYDLFSLDNQSCNLLYTSPAFLDLIGEVKQKYYTEEQTKKLQKNLQELIKKKNQSFDIKGALEIIYKDVFKVDKLKELNPMLYESIELALIPNVISAKIEMIINKKTFNYIFYFSKVERKEAIIYCLTKIISL